MKTMTITTEYIKLQDLLKLANAVETGGEAGFVSYVYNQCGWDFGRLGAQGLYNISTRTSSPKPGDLVFFTGTYDTPGISHVGIYVGDGWMLHCGDPISYANLNTSYWQSHFYAYGKLF